MPRMRTQEVKAERTEARQCAAALVRQARELTDETQVEFAMRMGVSQSLLSKYERGYVAPPSPMLVQCLELLHLVPVKVSQEQLLELVRSRLRGEEMAAVRTAIAAVIASIPVKK